MTWRCECGRANRWWFDACEGCGKPLHGFDHRSVQAAPLRSFDGSKIDFKEIERLVQEAARQLPPVPLPPGVRMTPDCGCPLYGTCMNVACPRRVQVTC